jgi:hypothetical protein
MAPADRTSRDRDTQRDWKRLRGVPGLVEEVGVSLSDLLVRSTEPPDRPDESSTHARSDRFTVSIASTTAGTIIWLVSALMSQHAPQRTWGMLVVVPISWYVGLALVTVGLVTSSGNRRYEGVASVASLFFALKATPAIVYDLPRVPFVTRHLGVVQYVLTHGSVHWNIDIYQSWPALFAATGWLTASLRFHNLLLLAKWWPAFIGAMGLVVFYPITTRFIADHRRRCLACAFLVLADSIGQDYFSPQSIGVVLALGIFLFAIPAPDETKRARNLRITAALALGVIVVPTHQLTPFLVVAGLTMLAVFRIIRPWWLPIPIAVTTIAWASLHWSSWHQYLKSQGLASNATTGSVPAGFRPENFSLDVARWGLAAGILIVGILALVAVLTQRTRVAFGLAACAAANAAILVVTNYGSEGSFRVALFALPWLAILAASIEIRKIPSIPILLATVPLLVVVHLFADYPLDAVFLMQPPDVSAAAYYNRVATPHTALVYGGVNPGLISANYFFAGGPLPVANPELADPGRAASALLPFLRSTHHGKTIYILFSASSARYDELFGLEPVSYYDSVERDLVASRKLRLVFRSGNTALYKVR